MSKPGRTPDFIIIGAMKSATSTLHKQLSVQPGIFMSTPKEPNFFSDDLIYKRGLDWYKGLFCEADADDICGESSTHYTKLPDYPDTVQRLKEAIPNPKLIYVMRNPIDRLISHYIHQWSEGVITCDMNNAIDRYPELVNYSCYGMQIDAYVTAFGKEAILLVSFEALKKKPQKVLEEIGQFIGYENEQALTWDFDLGPDNVSKKRVRKFFGFEVLINSSFMTFVRRKCIPKWFRTIVYQRLTMTGRPSISSTQLARIKAVFESDFHYVKGHFKVEVSDEK